MRKSMGYVFVNPAYTILLLCRFTHSITPMDMVHEKIFITAESKHVKMIVRGYYSHKQAEIQPFIEVWIKQRAEAHFSNPNELKLPMYGRFEREHKNLKDLVVKVSAYLTSNLIRS